MLLRNGKKQKSGETIPGEFFDELARVDRVELDGKVQRMRRSAFKV